MYREYMLAAVIAILPMKMNTLAIMLAQENLVMCLTFKRNPFQAEVQKDSPETAW